MHRPGKTNKADTLSQRPDYDQGESDNKDTIMLPPHLFVNVVRFHQELETLVRERQTDMESMGGNQKIDGIWENQGRVVVPDDDNLKRQILRLYHDHPLAGHPGILRTERLVAKDYWWLTMHQFVEGYVKGCGMCQATNV